MGELLVSGRGARSDADVQPCRSVCRILVLVTIRTRTRTTTTSSGSGSCGGMAIMESECALDLWRGRGRSCRFGSGQLDIGIFCGGERRR